MSNQQQSVILLRKAALAMMAFEWIQVAMGSVPISSALVLACVIVLPFPFYAALLCLLSETVTHLDIFPTFLFAAGGDLESLPQDVATYPPQLAYSENGMGYSMRDVYLEAQQTTLGDDRLRGWRMAEHKYLISHSGEE